MLAVMSDVYLHCVNTAFALCRTTTTTGSAAYILRRYTCMHCLHAGLERVQRHQQAHHPLPHPHGVQGRLPLPVQQQAAQGVCVCVCGAAPYLYKDRPCKVCACVWGGEGRQRPGVVYVWPCATTRCPCTSRIQGPYPCPFPSHRDPVTILMPLRSSRPLRSA